MSGNDRLWGFQFSDDVLSGGAGNDELNGFSGNDTLIGGSGFDTAIYYGNLNDFEIVTNANGNVSVTDSFFADGLNEGSDTLVDIERVYFRGDQRELRLVETFEGPTALSNVIQVSEIFIRLGSSGFGNILVDDLGGTQTISGQIPITFPVAPELVSVNGTPLVNGVANVTLNTGVTFTVTEDGFVGNLFLPDALNPAGGDTYVVQFDYTIANSANPLLTDTGNVSIEIAGTSDDLIIGTAQNDLIFAGGSAFTTSSTESTIGDDTFNGLAGIDTLSYASDLVGVSVDLSLGQATGQAIGTDTLISIENVIGGEAADMIVGNSFSNQLEGGPGSDIIMGGDGADTLDGGSGVDSLTGGYANDTYIVDDVLDAVIETALGDGDDTIQTSIDYDLPNFVERLVMTGNGDISSNGNSLANYMTGNAGDNYINGAAGTDLMTGGAGNDTYTIDSLNDVIIEQAGGGDDVVYSFNDAFLSGNIETLILAPTATNAVLGFGDDDANQLFGNEFDNVLFGRGGIDYMEGLGGNDIFVITPEDGEFDVIGDFENGGAGSGDRIGIAGFGAGAQMFQVSTTSFEVRSADNSIIQSFVLQGHDGSALVINDDYYFA